MGQTSHTVFWGENTVSCKISGAQMGYFKATLQGKNGRYQNLITNNNVLDIH